MILPTCSKLFLGVCLALWTGCGPTRGEHDWPVPQEYRACGPEALIEDGDDANNQIIVHDGRSGYVYTYKDDEGSTISPKAGSEGGTFEMTPGGFNSDYALRMNGTISNAQIAYAGMGLNLTDPKDTYDAGRYGGISFYAKRGARTTPTVRVKLPDVNTDPSGDRCGACYNDFGLDIKLSEEWQMYTIPFARLRQEPGWGAPRVAGLATHEVYAVQFQVKRPGPYDVWVDQVAFTGCGPASAD